MMKVRSRFPAIFDELSVTSELESGESQGNFWLATRAKWKIKTKVRLKFNVWTQASLMESERPETVYSAAMIDSRLDFGYKSSKF